LPYRFFDVFRALNQAVVEPADFKAKAVRAQVNCGKMGPVLHEAGAAWRSVSGVNNFKLCVSLKPFLAADKENDRFETVNTGVTQLSHCVFTVSACLFFFNP
jgi:hypothetical protein